MTPTDSSAASALEDARARPRTIAPAGVTKVGPCRLKTYTIAYEDPPQATLVEAARRAARTAVRALPGDVQIHGMGFLVIHDGCDGNMVLLGVWSNENELIFTTWTSTNEDPQDFKRVGGLRPRGCVWDLHVVGFEARTWLHTVLRGGEAGSRDAYLDAWFAGSV